MGWGLDRLAMIIKEIDDIRLLRHTDPRIANQTTNLEKYQPISNQPSVKRDLSLAVNQDLEIEDISEQILNALSRCDRTLIQSIEIISETNYSELPLKAIKRLGMKENQKNILIRITLQSLTNSLTNKKSNIIRDKIYRKLIKINN